MTYQPVNQSKEMSTRIGQMPHDFVGFPQQIPGFTTMEPWAAQKSMLMVQQGSCSECCLPICCHPNNRYELYEGRSNDEPGGMPMGQMKEDSNCCCKCCLRQFRPWTMTLEIPGVTLISAERKCFYAPPCNFCCCCREAIEVSEVNQHIGKVYYPYMCYGRNRCCMCPFQEIDVHDQSGNLKYYVSATCCQSGVLARLCCCIRSCGPCRTIEFDIFEPSSKQKIGVIQNVYNGICLEVCTKADKYYIEYPANAQYRDKVLLNFAAIMVDYNVFEDFLP